jgi:hypothetical protein
MEGAFLAVTLVEGSVKVFKLPAILNPFVSEAPAAPEKVTAPVAEKGKPGKASTQITPTPAAANITPGSKTNEGDFGEVKTELD